MKIYISYFYKIRFFKSNMIPVSTTGGTGGPLWYIGGNRLHPIYFLDKNNVINGIREESLALPASYFENLNEQCEKNCPYKNKAPNCQFMKAYSSYLDTLNINYLLSEFERIAKDVKRINNYQGEPEIVLMVYESPDIICAERPCLINYFKKNGIEITEF